MQHSTTNLTTLMETTSPLSLSTIQPLSIIIRGMITSNILIILTTGASDAIQK